MTNIILIGCLGRLGIEISNYISTLNDYQIIAGVDIKTDYNKNLEYNIYKNTQEIIDHNIVADVVIDFSHHSALKSTLTYCKQTATPLVIGTTGINDIEKAEIINASKYIPIFWSVNMSIGINILTKVCNYIIDCANNMFEIDIIEKHHNKKLDSPSGTATMIAKSLKSHFENKYKIKKNIRDNSNIPTNPRDPNDIIIHSIRSGNLVGQHDIVFSCEDETLTISHIANSKKIFAKGAITAANFIITQNPGLYKFQ